MRPLLSFRAALAVLLLGPSSSALSAQSVVVHVTAAESGAPLAGALVSLLDAEGEAVRRALSDGVGRAVLAAPGAGTFRVQAELIGRESATSEPFAVGGAADGTAAGGAGGGGAPAPIRLALAAHAIALAEIVVEADQRCRIRPDQATELARVWDEARKSLAVQAWTESQGSYRLDLSTWQRELDATGRTVEHESRRERSSVTRMPFRSLPIEELTRVGFVRRLAGGGHEYYGPDAPTLLSDAFLDTHCFRLRRSDDVADAIGLAFEPADRGGPPDIEGTLWVDEATAELRFLEYRYTWAPYVEAAGIAGGRVAFRALPDGAWIVDHWWIRMPSLGRDLSLARGTDSGIRVVGIRETGGEVTGVSTIDRIRIAGAARGTVTGVVWDSTAAAPLAGAMVELAGTSYRGETDGDGRFLLGSVPGGVFTTVFTHPRLDALDVEPAGVEVQVVPGRTTDVALAVPSESTILVAACSAQTEEGGRDGAAAGAAAGALGTDPLAAAAVLTGVVRERTSGRPVPGARVRVDWQEVVRMQPMVQARDRFLEVGSDGQGRYTLCGLPLDEALAVRAIFLDRRGDVESTAFAVPGHRALDLALALPAELVPDETDSPTRTFAAAYGAQGVQGVLVERTSGKPVQAAEVTVRRASGALVASAPTDRRGFFRVETPVPGPYVISAEALGYGAVESQAVDVELGKLAVLEVQMAPEAFEMEPIVVTAEARSFHLEMEGFYRRQQEGAGFFVTPALLERRRPSRITDLFFGVPGVRIAEPIGGRGGRVVQFNSTLGCFPMVYVDRHLVSTGGIPAAGAEPTAIDELVHPADIAAVEVFRSPAEIPSEFNGPNAGCGVVVLWTPRGGG